MTIQKAKTLKPFVSKVKVIQTGKVLMVRLIQTSRCAKTNAVQNILLKLDDGTWYTNDEVTMA